jgi:hypothetical protein
VVAEEDSTAAVVDLAVAEATAADTAKAIALEIGEERPANLPAVFFC